MEDEADLDTHMCLGCQATIFGLENYIHHKKHECPIKRKSETSIDKSKPAAAGSPSQLVLPPLELPSEPHMCPTTVVDAINPNMVLNPGINESEKFTDFISSLELKIRSVVSDQHGASKDIDPTILLSNEYEKDKRDDNEPNEFTKSLAACISSIADEDNLPITNLLTNLAFDSDSDLDNLSEYLASDSEDDTYPPSSYTGGKWKPGTAPHQRKLKSSVRTTGGKWKPGMGKLSKSGLEQETSERTDEEDMEDEDILSEPELLIKLPDEDPPQQTELEQYSCPICKKDFHNKFNMARHLLTAYHQKRAACLPSDNLCLLERYHDQIRRLSPFQCRFCKFYCNTNDDLLFHLKNQSHSNEAGRLLGPQLCVLCGFKSPDNNEMVDHIASEEHITTASAKTKTRPCVIRECRYNVQCSFCGKTLHSVVQLQKHLISNHSDIRKALIGAHKCNLCLQCGGKKFSSRMALQIHIRRRHTKERPYTCIPCNKSFCDKYTFRLHERTKKHIATVTDTLDGPEKKKKKIGRRQPGSQKFKCNYCDFTAKKYALLRPHHLTEHANEGFKCMLCNITFLKERQLDLHLMTKQHEKLGETLAKTGCLYTCHRCNKNFASEKVLAMHQLSHETTIFDPPGLDDNSKFADFIKNMPRGGNTRIKCPECDKVMNKTNMISHLRRHEDRLPFECFFCNKHFTSGAILRRHLNAHIGVTTFPCDECGKIFTKSSSLKSHIAAIHQNLPRNFGCDLCDRKFAQKWQLKHHKMIHGNKQYPCTFPDCKLRFRTNSDLIIHTRTHTNERPFLCDECGYAGKSRNQLTRHRRTHTGERNFSCQFCPYKAMNSTHLRRHMRIHIGSKPYKCPYCQYACNTHENIRKHILSTKKHAGLKIYPCKFCSFGTNEAKEFKDHMKLSHTDKVGDGDLDVTSIFSGLYDKSGDPKDPPEGSRVLPVKERRKKDELNDLSGTEKNVSGVGLQVEVSPVLFAALEQGAEQEHLQQVDAGTCMSPNQETYNVVMEMDHNATYTPVELQDLVIREKPDGTMEVIGDNNAIHCMEIIVTQAPSDDTNLVPEIQASPILTAVQPGEEMSPASDTEASQTAGPNAVVCTEPVAMTRNEKDHCYVASSQDDIEASENLAIHLLTSLSSGSFQTLPQ